MKQINFRTSVTPKEFDFDFSYKDKAVLIGSCFSNNIGAKLQNGKFDVLINPYGVLFNPVSICRLVEGVFSTEKFQEDNLILHNGLYHSFLHHGDFSGTGEEEVLLRIKESNQIAKSYLSEAKVVFITLGSAWVYKYIPTGNVVANCHKIPNGNFSKELLSVNQVVEALNTMVQLLKKENKDLKIVFTVSPVRHLKDGMIENNMSKSTLILAVHNVLKELQDGVYFPAYEMVVDDLRDYRFYKEDMLHPNDVAVNYIWEGIKESLFKPATLSLLKRIEKLKNAVNHRPINPTLPEHQTFIKKQIDQIEDLIASEPNIDMKEELNNLKRQLI